MKEEDVLKLCDHIRTTALELHSYLRHGHMERVYENGLVNRLRKKGIKVMQQHPLQVQNEHIAQTLGYMRASGSKHALLINFGSTKIQIKKLII